MGSQGAGWVCPPKWHEETHCTSSSISRDNFAVRLRMPSRVDISYDGRHQMEKFSQGLASDLVVRVARIRLPRMHDNLMDEHKELKAWRTTPRSGCIESGTFLSEEGANWMIIARSVYTSMEDLLAAQEAENGLLQSIMEQSEVKPVKTTKTGLEEIVEGLQACFRKCTPQENRIETGAGSIAWGVKGQMWNCGADAPLPMVFIFASCVSDAAAEQLLEHVRAERITKAFGDSPSLRTVVMAELLIYDTETGSSRTSSSKVAVLRLMLSETLAAKSDEVTKAVLSLLPSGRGIFIGAPRAMIGLEEWAYDCHRPAPMTPKKAIPGSESGSNVAQLMANFRQGLEAEGLQSRGIEHQRSVRSSLSGV